jgi:hypothetical protein
VERDDAPVRERLVGPKQDEFLGHDRDAVLGHDEQADQPQHLLVGGERNQHRQGDYAPPDQGNEFAVHTELLPHNT